MPDPSLPRRPPPLSFGPVPEATEADRRLFEEAVAEGPIEAAAVARTAPARSRPPRPSSLLRDLQAGRRRVSEGCEISIRQRTQPVARTVLEGFLRRRRAQGARFVTVIHGKGYRSPGGRAVLARRVPDWLAAWKPELVAGWGVARAEDGGSGALYVVLTPPCV